MLTSDLADWAAGVRFDEIPAASVAAAKALLLDSLGCLIGGTVNEPAAIAVRAVRRLSADGGAATALAAGAKFSARDAAFINGMTLYSVGLNGYHKGAMLHPGVSVIPALLALGEEQDSSGRDILAAMAVGYDVCARIGAAMAPAYLERGFNGNGIIGVFGAAAAAGNLLKLTPEQVRNAFGIAGSQAAGLNEWHHDAALTVVFHAGRAAQNGIEACRLAQAGLSGPATVLEGREGFLQAFGKDAAAEKVCDGLGSFAAVRQTTIRPHFGATSTIAASGGAAELMVRLNAKAADVAEVTVRTYTAHVAAHDLARPATLQAARQSLQYNVAQAIGRGLLVRDIRESDLRDPLVQAALPLIRIIGDDAIARFGAQITIRLKDGRGETLLNTAPPGDPANPLDWNRMVEKFLGLAAGAGCGAAQARPVAAAVADFEQQKMGDFMALLKAAAPASKLAATKE